MSVQLLVKGTFFIDNVSVFPLYLHVYMSFSCELLLSLNLKMLCFAISPDLSSTQESCVMAE